MTLYRWDFQKKLLTGLVPTGVYYWTNVHYVEANNPTEFDSARTEVFENEQRAHNANVQFDRWKCTRVSDGVVIQNNSLSQHGELTTGPYLTAFGTIFQFFRCADGSVSYKRWRVPLRAADIDGQVLSSSFVALWEAIGPAHADPNWLYHTNVHGSHITEAILSPLVHSWQFRHGTKRSTRRRIV